MSPEPCGLEGSGDGSFPPLPAPGVAYGSVAPGCATVLLAKKTHPEIPEKMKALGDTQVRTLSSQGDFPIAFM